MSNQKSQFWIEVDEAEREVRAAVAKCDRQPRDGAVYLTSLKVRGADPNSRAGVVSLATVRLAAQRVVEGSQRLSSDAEIDEYLLLEAQRKKEVLAGGPAKNTMIFQQPRPVEVKP